VIDRFRFALTFFGRRLLTAPLRRRLRWAYAGIVGSQLGRHRSFRKRTLASGIAVTGQLRAPSGLGAGARAFAHWFVQQGAAVHGLDVNIYQREVDFEPLPKAPREFSGLVLCVSNPPHLAQDLLRVRRSRLRPCYVIAHWVWELARCPREWSRFERIIDEIWVPSEFVRGALVPIVRIPVRVVPYPLSPPRPASRSLSSFGLRQADFVVLTALDFRSGFYRKNVVGSVRAFRMAFGDDPGALLIVKVDGRKYEPRCARELAAEIANAANVVVLDEVLSSADMSSLIANSDAILSMHRSEGFGLLMAEAMLHSKPVVATAWSGNLDFMDENSAVLVPYSLVKIKDPQGIYAEFDGEWAEPDIESASQSLRRLAHEPQFAARLGKQGHTRVAAFFDDAKLAAAMGFLAGCDLQGHSTGAKHSHSAVVQSST
jgi:glycosyltransferase involved in cell wall biosynthesis